MPPGTFSTQVQLTITAPNVLEIGNAGDPGYRAICGIGIGITVNGTIYTGTFGHQLTLTIPGFAIKHGDRVVLWNGTSFGFVPATVSSIGVQFSFTGSGEDFAVLAPRAGWPVRGPSGRGQHRRPQQPGNPGSGSGQPLPHARRPFSGRDRGPGS